jgi:hypothetical protein
MKFCFEGAITSISLYDNVTSSITISNVQPGHAIQKITLEIANKDIAKAIIKAHGVDTPFNVTIEGGA